MATTSSQHSPTSPRAPRDDFSSVADYVTTTGTDELQHIHRRIFLGPMPEKVISKTEEHIAKRRTRKLGFFRSAPEEEGPDEEEPPGESLPKILKEHALSFFLNEGGNIEDWDDEREESTRREMLAKWRENQWAHVWRRRRSTQTGKSGETGKASEHWVGDSFEIGNFLGVNLLHGQHPDSIRERLSAKSTVNLSLKASSSPSASTGRKLSHRSSYSASSNGSPVNARFTRSSIHVQESSGSMKRTASAATNVVSFVTARDQIGPPFDARQSSGESSMNGGDASSSTGLLRPSPPTTPTKSHSDVGERPGIFKGVSNGAKSDSHADSPALQDPFVANASPFSAKGKGKKLVHYADVDETPEPQPVPPTTVLERSGSEVDETSAGATIEAPPDEPALSWGDVVMRDRMLVRVSYTKTEKLGPFDEDQNRTTRDLQYEDWGEFMVVWRADRLELYKDYSMPGKEWFSGHKELAFLVPLKKPDTRLSLYSFVDLTFCLTAPPVHPSSPSRSKTSKARAIFRRAKEGTNVFVFKLKSRSRALDWTWHLWEQLGGELPPSLVVSSPLISEQVVIDLPPGATRQLSSYNREAIIEQCRDTMASNHDWINIVERYLNRGNPLELAWRMETKLDWIWADEDIDGKKRDWAVLCGFALKQADMTPQLELHLKLHAPSLVRLSEEKHLKEPAAIEGYLDRITGATQARHAVYLATHEGTIFSLSQANAHPPAPPGLEAPEEDATAALRVQEVRRGALQVMEADGSSDLRDIVAVRRAFQVVPAQQHSETGDEQFQTPGHEQMPFETWVKVDQVESDVEDQGGEDGLAKVEDKPRLKMMRSFELLLSNGHVIRFETHSRRHALEWISHLRALIYYWKQRHRVDAHEEMDLVQVSSRKPPLTPHTRLREHRDAPPEPPPDPEAELPGLGFLYNWCVIDGCKPLLRAGKVFTRRGFHGQYKLVQMFALSRHLVMYHITPRSSLHHRRSKTVSLLDAYVYSGYLAAVTLPEGQYSPVAPTTPRRYPDGLEADDREEDTIFMVSYWKHAQLNKAKEELIEVDADMPQLRFKRKVAIFRTRSKLERDAWCWVINTEIERMARLGREREKRLREAGGLVDL